MHFDRFPFNHLGLMQRSINPRGRESVHADPVDGKKGFDGIEMAQRPPPAFRRLMVEPIPLPSPQAGQSEPDARVASAVARLMADVNRKCGFRPGDQLEKRLIRLVRAMPADTVFAWVTSLERLHPSDPDWLGLVEQLTVHETYFFRERDQLALLMERHLGPLLAARRDRGRREITIWSAGCSTGEEAYSLAILVLEELVRLGEAEEMKGDTPDTSRGILFRQPWAITILGTDIARPAIQQAERGIYRCGAMSAFRDLPTAHLRFFEDLPPRQAPVLLDGTNGGMLRRVRADVRALVRFQVHNLTDLRTPLPAADVILCRNVLIYLDDEARGRVIDRLVGALGRDGALLLGTTDMIRPDPSLVIERGEAASFLRRRPMDRQP